MTRPFCLILAILCVFAGESPAADAKPNIIFILADDIGLPGCGCTGGIYKTPNIDSLAAGGTRFENCFAAPLCAPSRAMLMTGRYAFRTGVMDNGLGAQATPDKDGCVAQLMKQAGYATAVAGKWRQLSYLRSKEDAAKWGFDEFLIWGAGDPEEGEESAAKTTVGPGGKKNKKSRYWNPDYNLNGKSLTDSADKYGPDALQDFVIDFIRRHKDGPFFVYYPTPFIHSPLLPTPDSASKGTGEKLKTKKTAASAGGSSRYADNIAYLDKQVGQLVAVLEELHLRENTLIVFTGDNGSVPVGTVNGRAVDGHKHTMLEGGSRVPLIANWPGTTPAGTALKDLVDFSDMLPTFAQLAGAELPQNRIIDGQSFAPQLLGKTGAPREWAYVQLGNHWYAREQDWKLTESGALFDMTDAPFAEKPVPEEGQNAGAATARKRLQAVLATLDPVGKSAPSDGEPKKKRKKLKASAKA